MTAGVPTSLNSVMTNLGAQIALQSLSQAGTDLQASEKRISTGFRVADPLDDGGAFAVAQNVRADANALGIVNGQLGNAQGLIATTLSTLRSLSDSIGIAKGILVRIADASISQTERDQADAAYESLIRQVADAVDHSSYEGKTLLGSVAGAQASASLAVVSTENGGAITLHAEDSSNLPNELATLIGSTFTRSATGVDSFGPIGAGADQSSASTALTTTFGVQSFALVQSGVDNQLNQAGADSNLVIATVTANKDKIDSLNAGLGALIDADLSRESARYQALQIRQQLATQTLAAVDQAPLPLLTLFKP